MAGGFSFSERNWAASSWAAFYVMRFLAARAPDASIKAELNELVEYNIPMLDLRSPEQALLVDLIADDLPVDAQDIEDLEARESLRPLLAELVQRAREQQAINRLSHDPS